MNIRQIIQKAREFQKSICFIDYAKAFDCVDQSKLWKILRETVPDHLTYLLGNLYAGQEPTVRTGHGTTDCGMFFRIPPYLSPEKPVCGSRSIG